MNYKMTEEDVQRSLEADRKDVLRIVGKMMAEDKEARERRSRTMEHTKRPWLRDGRTVYALNEQGTNSFCCSVHPGHIPGYDCEEIQLANACLIETVPELLEECETISTWWNDHRDGWIDASDFRQMMERFEKIIAKAKGDQACQT